MKKKRHSPEQIVKILRAMERAVGEGRTAAEAIKEHEVTEQTYYRWRRQYGQMPVDDVKRLKDMEKENARLKKLLAEAELDKLILKEALKGNW